MPIRPPCPDTHEVNPKTGFCIKKCAPGQIRNKKTGRCAHPKATRSVRSKAAVSCPSTHELNPNTGLCIKKCGFGQVRSKNSSRCVFDRPYLESLAKQFGVSSEGTVTALACRVENVMATKASNIDKNIEKNKYKVQRDLSEFVKKKEMVKFKKTLKPYVNVLIKDQDKLEKENKVLSQDQEKWMSDRKKIRTYVKEILMENDALKMENDALKMELEVIKNELEDFTEYARVKIQEAVAETERKAEIKAIFIINQKRDEQARISQARDAAIKKAIVGNQYTAAHKKLQKKLRGGKSLLQQLDDCEYKLKAMGQVMGQST